MKRSTRAEKAQQTLKIIEQGFYEVNGRKVSVQEAVTNGVKQATLYKTEAFGRILEDVDEQLKGLDFDTTIHIENMTVLKAAQQMTAEGKATGCLNFASAKNPGGGFLGGAQAQEESLALSSTLYPTLMEHFEMYEYNRGRSTFLYSDYMICSPHVLLFRNDDGDLLEEPYGLTIITSPAVNIGAMKSHDRKEELAQAAKVMLQRMDKVLALFVRYNVRHLLLGPWGCGVFQNEAADVAGYFAQYLLNGGKYARAFQSVTFAILDRSRDQEKISAFEHAFGM